jgi:hypothetical protein
VKTFRQLLSTGMRAAHPSTVALLIRDASGMQPSPKHSMSHLDAAMGWIGAAHDRCEKQGVSAGFSLRHGWLPPYPETTGYLIPTLLDYALLTGNEEYRDRAKQMADWECELQLDCGGVMGGVYRVGDVEAEPVVFNTGQVILGWVRAYRDIKNEKYLESAQLAGDWLLKTQSEDGSWRLPGVETDTAVHAYDARTAWSLLELHKVTGQKSYSDAAQRNLAWTLAQDSGNGWYENNAFFLDSKWNMTFTHTIAYVVEGLIESWRHIPNPEYLHAAQRTAEKLLRIFEIRRYMPGDFDRTWKSDAKYSCLTGDAQIAGIWLQLFEITQDTRYLSAALKLNDYVKSTQSLNSLHPGIRGGIKGSQPIWGSYTPYTFINWGAKFFADSLMLEKRVMAEFEAAVERVELLGPRDLVNDVTEHGVTEDDGVCD